MNSGQKFHIYQKSGSAAVLYWDDMILSAVLTAHFSQDMEKVSKAKSGETGPILARTFCVVNTVTFMIQGQCSVFEKDLTSKPVRALSQCPCVTSEGTWLLKVWCAFEYDENTNSQ